MTTVHATGSPARPGTGSSLGRVREAVGSGTGTLDDVARATGLDRELVRLAVDELLRLGVLAAEPLAVGCPSSGCGSCPAASAGSSCAGSAVSARGLITLIDGTRRVAQSPLGTGGAAFTS